MNNIKEDFCPACVAIPMAMAGIGASAYGASEDKHTNKDEYKARKKLIFGIGVSFTLVSILVAIYFIYFKDCKKCR